MTVQNPAPWPAATPAQQPTLPPLATPAGQQPYVPPVAPTAPAAPPRPPLTKAAASRARLAGAVGGGIAWLGLGISQAALVLLFLPLLVAGVIFGVGFAIADGGPSATAEVWPQLAAWLGSAGGVLLIAAIPLGVVVWLVGLWVSARLLRTGGVHRPVGVTWAGFGVALGANVLLGTIGSFTISPFMGGLPFAPNLDVDASDTDWGQQEWAEGLESGGVDLDPGMLERLADPAQLIAFAAPWVALGTLASLIVPVVLSLLSWWWMAHALRAPAADERPAVTT